MMLSNIFPFHLKQNKSLDAVVENLQFTYFSKYGYFFPFTGEDNSQVYLDFYIVFLQITFLVTNCK